MAIVAAMREPDRREGAFVLFPIFQIGKHRILIADQGETGIHTYLLSGNYLGIFADNMSFHIPSQDFVW